MIKKPMKAPRTGASLDQLKAMIDDHGAIACSPKLDGIRGVCTPNGVMSNSLKLLGNTFMQRELNNPMLNGLDGELIVGLPYKDLNQPDDDVFNRTSGAIRRGSGEPDFKFYVFDDFTDKSLSYLDRWLDSRMLCHYLEAHPRIVILEQRICRTWEEALKYENELLALGYEGMMPRTLTGHYKEGRATDREALILKRKPLAQREGKIVDIFEQMKNNNEKATNELGDSFRTAHQENKEGKGTLGGVILHDPHWITPNNPEGNFSCGTIIGGTVAWRQKMWDNPNFILGKTMTYVYQEYGSIDKPRQPRGKAEFRWDHK